MLLSRLAPIIFVFLWSTGWVTAKYAVDYAGPLTFLTVRFLLSAVALYALCWIMKVSLPKSGIEIGHAMMSGVLLHGIYLGMIWWAIGEGVPASIGGIIAGLQPLLTGCAAYFLLRERLNSMQAIGLVLGFIGIFIAVLPKALALDGEISNIPLYAVIVNMLGMVSITYGTIYQKRYVHSTHVLAAACLQYIGGALVTLPVAIFTEDFHYEITWVSSLAMLWAVAAISIGAVLLLLLLINRGEVSKAASLIYLVPALAAVEAAILFGESLTTAMIIGTIIAALGVYLTNRRKTTP
jgi:drug/metabolite transporter (DMT)-like permease